MILGQIEKITIDPGAVTWLQVNGHAFDSSDVDRREKLFAEAVGERVNMRVDGGASIEDENARVFREHENGKWEVVADEDNEMVRIRWSIPSRDGRYLFVRHYRANDWGKSAVQSECDRFNNQGKKPWEILDWKP